jgi:phosphatidylglycerophosphatase C
VADDSASSGPARPVDPIDRPVVAAFDFDGTLTNGGSVWKFLVYVAGRRRALAAGVRALPLLILAALVGGASNDAAKEALFVRLLAGRSIADLAPEAEKFGLAHLRARARPEVYRRARWHAEQGHQVVLVSASPEIYLKGVAAELGAAGLVATRLEVSTDGCLTGRYVGGNCRGPEKARRLREWIAQNEAVSVPFVWAYGNSAGDREMLRNADVGVDAGRLGRFGKLRGFPRLSAVLAGDQPGTDAPPTTVPE